MESKPRHPDEIVGALREWRKRDHFLNGRTTKGSQVVDDRMIVLLDELSASITAMQQRLNQMELRASVAEGILDGYNKTTGLTPGTLPPNATVKGL